MTDESLARVEIFTADEIAIVHVMNRNAGERPASEVFSCQCSMFRKAG